MTYLATVAVFSLLCGYDPIYQLLSGGLILGAFFMATDYSTSPSPLPAASSTASAAAR